MTKGRNVGIDILKALLAFTVIFGHVLQIAISDGDSSDVTWVVKNFIYSFHMPLFAFISGFFANAKLPIVDYTKQKFKQLILPVFFWGIIIAAYNVIVLGMGQLIVVKNFIIYDLWYLKSLFIILLISWPFFKYHSIIYCLLTLIFGFLCGGLFLFALLIPSFYLGCFIKKILLKKSCLLILFLSSVVVFVIELLFINPSMNVGDLNLLRTFEINGIINYFNRLLLALSACITFFVSFYYINSLSFVGHRLSWLGNIGQQSLAIYAIQSLFVEKFGRLIIHEINILCYLLLSLLLFIFISFIIILAVRFIDNKTTKTVLGIS